MNTASVCGIVPLPYQTVYAASKYAVVGFGEDLRYEMSFHNIKVTTVCPGAVELPLPLYNFNPKRKNPTNRSKIEQTRDRKKRWEGGREKKYCQKRTFRKGKTNQPQEPTRREDKELMSR